MVEPPPPPPSPPFAVAVQPRPARRPRDRWLRAALFCIVLGGALTVIYGLALARQDAAGGMASGGMQAYHEILVPLLALVAIAGGLILERAPVLGTFLLVLGSGFAIPGGGIYLLPGAIVGCAWSAVRSSGARLGLGFLLLFPGIAGGYYGMLAALSFWTQQPVPGLPPSLNPALNWRQALTPLDLLPLALLGAWLLTSSPGRRPGAPEQA